MENDGFLGYSLDSNHHRNKVKVMINLTLVTLLNKQDQDSTAFMGGFRATLCYVTQI